jgi:hypothetical protein
MSNGNVGIGTSNPSTKLQVAGTLTATDLVTSGPWLDVRALGAVGDGVTDDTAAIQAAINQSRNVFIPAGVYRISSALEVGDGQVISGAGRDISILKSTGGISVIKKKSSLDVVKYVTLEKFQIVDGFGINVPGTGTAFDLKGFSYSRIHDVTIALAKYGIFLARGSNPLNNPNYFNTVTDVYCRSVETCVLLQDDGTGLTPNANTFENITADDVGVWGVGVAGTSVGVDVSGYGNRFNNVYFGTEVGVRIRTVAGNNVFTGLYIEGADVADITLGTGTSGRVNYIYGAHFDRVGSPIIIDPNKELNIYGSQGTTTLSGNLGVGTASPADKLDVKGDIRVGTGTTGCVKDADGSVVAGTCSSDERLKTNILQLGEGVLEKMLGVRPVTYTWNELAQQQFQYSTTESQLGLVAQQVESVFPELVVTNPASGYKQVRFSDIPIYLLASLQEMWKRTYRTLDDHNSRLAELERTVQQLTAAQKGDVPTGGNDVAISINSPVTEVAETTEQAAPIEGIAN